MHRPRYAEGTRMEWGKSRNRKPLRLWALFGFLAVAFGAVVLLSVWFSASDRPTERRHPAVDERSDAVCAADDDRAADTVPTDDAPSPRAVADDDPADVQPDADTLNLLQQAIRDYLDLPAGRISRVDAWTNLEFLRQHRDAVRGYTDQLVNSDDEHDRLLALFLHLELYDDIAGLLNQVKLDPSPYVWAEAAGWLYEQGRFDELQAYIENV
jgi:hypothetical protein